MAFFSGSVGILRLLVIVMDHILPLQIGFRNSNDADVVKSKKSYVGWINGNADTDVFKQEGSIGAVAVLRDCDVSVIAASMISQISCFFKPYVAEAVSIRESTKLDQGHVVGFGNSEN